MTTALRARGCYLAGLKPATCCLGVGFQPSTGYRLVSFTLVRLAVPSVWSPPVLRVVPGGMTARMTGDRFVGGRESSQAACRPAVRNARGTEAGHTGR
jgi:hypothetical protein